MWAMELVLNKEARERIVAADRHSIYAKTLEMPASANVCEVCIEEGVAVGAFLPNSIRWATALVVTKANIDFGLRARQESRGTRQTLRLKFRGALWTAFAHGIRLLGASSSRVVRDEKRAGLFSPMGVGLFRIGRQRLYN